MSNVTSVMTANPACCTAQTPLRDVARMMIDNDCGQIPVVDAQGMPLGVVTDRDITIRAVAEGHDPKVTRVREAMGGDLVYCFEDQDSSEAAELMAENDIRRLPVLSSDKRLVGVVSLGDLAAKTGDDDIVGQTVQDISSSPSNS